MKVGASSTLIQASRTASRVLEGNAVVIVIDRQSLHTLDDVGTFVWTHAERRVRISDLADRVAEEYDVTAAQALEDICAFATELHRLGALVVEDEK